MRLKCIKLAGFKSFVDPTTVNFPSNLGAVVGPNGCGKSNIIDAVRWVMGESSAKNLRGENMTDVIFNGSSGRKPVGQATIELVFDNTEGRLLGEYASYAEISIRRKVTRDGQNIYYLNGIKCRRRDITDIFLGTGLGPRSYAIIEQGMISRLIEARPEDLRIFIEEAAGISKYKERRRDTESRIRRTHENLERLTDIRDELERQISRLERQAQSAEKYGEYKKEERELKAQLQALRYRVLAEQVTLKRAAIRELEVEVESFVTAQVNKDTLIEKYRVQYTDLGDKFNEVQGRYYAIGSDIARIEQNITHTQDRIRQLTVDLDQTRRDCKEAGEHLRIDSDKAEGWQAELLEIEPELALVQSAGDNSGELLQEAEEQMQQWQIEWDEFNQSASEPRQRAEVQQSRIQHLEQVQSRLLDRIRKLDEEKSLLTAGEVEEEIGELNEQLSELEMEGEESRARNEQTSDDLNNLREANNQISNTLDEKKSKLQTLRGRHASLEALQQAALGEQNKVVTRWLENHELADKPRLAQGLRVSGGWDKAVETVLGNNLQAVCTDGLDSVAVVLDSLTQGQLLLVEKSTQVAGSAGGKATTLDSFIESEVSIASLVGQVYAVETLAEALALRGQLNANESVITKDAIWIGPNWLRVVRDNDATAGVIARRQELEEIAAHIEALEGTVAAQTEQLNLGRERVKELEQSREQLRRALDEHGKRFSEIKAQLTGRQVRIEQMLERKKRIVSDIAEGREQMELEAENLSEARMLLEGAIDAMERDTGMREELMTRRDGIRAKLDEARQKARHDKDRTHELAMRVQSLRTQLSAIQSGMSRLQEQTVRLTERREHLEAALADNHDPIEEFKLELEALLERRVNVETELTDARKAVETVEHDLRAAEQQRNRAEQDVQKVRGNLEQERIQTQTLEVQKQGFENQLKEEEFELEALLAILPEDAEEAPMVQTLEQIGNRITRLGPINLAAIDEYKSESERKNYLDAQNADLVEALDTLENAIRKIDRETRTRFKETFDQVNSGLQELFPKVFGGGHAYLELTGEDLLDTGIAIMARPPGKRNSTIHLLSGGEKALTAIALVFSIFRLNPAPFCMLDEVDAPLDDANVGRYARLVEEMSAQVQFIYITHNKIAMEMAHQLMGVTMHEPGVSRLVTVDVEQAAELAAS